MSHTTDLRPHVNVELIVRYKTKIDNREVFYSDLNGYQTVRRQFYAKIPLQGNYYPMPALAFLQDYSSGLRFSVHTRQAVGVASLQVHPLFISLNPTNNFVDPKLKDMKSKHKMCFYRT